MNNFTVRAAQAKDHLQAAPLIYTAGPEAFDFIFKYPNFCSAEDFLQVSFQRPNGQFSYVHHTVIEVDARVVATMLNYDNAQLSAMHWRTVTSVLSFFSWRAVKVAKLGAVVEKIMPAPADDVLVVANLAVAENAQGHGLGSKLIEHARARAIREGYRALALDVSIENPSAQSLYERLGFVVIKEHPSPTDKVPGHRYMEAVL
jgi:ribosomal protein S18 acetylase RimI-like enzyme